MALVDTYGPFDAGGGANITESTWRSFMRRMRGDSGARSGVIPGSANGFQVYADSTGMQVKAKSGECWLEGHYGFSGSDKTIAIATADATNPRKDRIVLQADFVNNTVEVIAVTGTPAGSPTAPGLTQDSTKWQMSLAIVDVPAGDTNIDAGQVTDSRQYLDSPSTLKRLAANFTKNNSTALSDVTDLQFSASAYRTYAVDGYLVYDTTTTADAKFKLTAPSGAVLRQSGGAVAITAPNAHGDLDGSAVDSASAMLLGGGGAGNVLAAQLKAVLAVSDTSGLLTLQWAQNTAEVSNTILMANSWMRITPII